MTLKKSEINILAGRYAKAKLKAAEVKKIADSLGKATGFTEQINGNTSSRNFFNYKR